MGAEEALVDAEPATIVGVDVNVLSVDCGPGARTGLIAHVRRDGATFEVALADLTLPSESALGLVVGRRIPALAGPVRAWPRGGRVPGNGRFRCKRNNPCFADL